MTMFAIAVRRRCGGVPAAAPVALFVGALRYYKGLSYVFEALVLLPDLRLIVVGTGPMEAEWKRHTRALGIAARVSFVGEVTDTDLPAHYAASDIVVLPSTQRSEAFGVVQLEAMAAGKPVVCTALGTGTDFVNADGVSGFVVRPCYADALAHALKRLSDDAGLRQSSTGAIGPCLTKQESGSAFIR